MIRAKTKQQQAKQKAVRRSKRSTSSAHSRGYTSGWSIVAKQYLAKNPFCVRCKYVLGKRTLATVVDHIIPAQVAPNKFMDSSNWQALCTSCHASAKQSAENKGLYPNYATGEVFKQNCQSVDKKGRGGENL